MLDLIVYGVVLYLGYRFVKYVYEEIEYSIKKKKRSQRYGDNRPYSYNDPPPARGSSGTSRSSTRTSTYRPPTRTPSIQPRPSSSIPTRTAVPSKPKTYRPQQYTTSQGQFSTPKAPSYRPSSLLRDIEDLHDAFTGAPLDPKLGLYQCQSCKVYYHASSYRLLVDENQGRCVACQNRNIIQIGPSEGRRQGTEYKPGVVTLENFRDKEGSVVTFEGFVHDVYESQRGGDFAVMFENKSWTRGFKMVVFQDDVYRVGGESYIKDLKGKTIRIRGLIVLDERFGYEMIVSEREMVLGVEQ